MIRTILIAAGSFFALVLLCFASVYFYTRSNTPVDTATTTDPFGFTGATGTVSLGSEQPVPLTLLSGKQVTVPNFIPETQPEWASPDYGYEVYSVEDASFSILFYPNNSGFLISLLAEPLGESRTAAEKELQSRVPLTQSELCQLQLQVFTSIDVNETYAGTNLGLSFCPGAVALPQ